MSKLTSDHEIPSFACDPNFQLPDNLFSTVCGAYSSSDRNLYGRKMS